MTLNLGVGWLCISSGDFVVQVNIFLSDGAFRIVGDGLPAGLLGEAGIIRVGKCPVDAVGKNPRTTCIAPRIRCAGGLSFRECRPR